MWSLISVLYGKNEKKFYRSNTTIRQKKAKSTFFVCCKITKIMCLCANKAIIYFTIHVITTTITEGILLKRQLNKINCLVLITEFIYYY